MKRPRLLSNAIPDREIPHWSARTACRYVSRAMRLQCPVCGQSPIFPPLRHSRRLYDWFNPNDGCPRCGFPFEREPGYFLLAIWVINYGVSTTAALIVYLVMEYYFHTRIGLILAATMIPLPLLSIGIARHAKALFLALDHFCDPTDERHHLR